MNSSLEDFSLVWKSVFVCFLICVFLSAKAAWVYSFCKLPPGPWGLPLIGASFPLGNNPHLDFTKMSQKYGDVFSLMLGNRLVVVLNGVDAIQEAITKHSTAFAGRPNLHTFQIANLQGNSLVLTDYSPQWRLSRKITVGAIHNFVKGKAVLEEKLLHESQRLIHCLKQQKGRPVDALFTLKCATANITLEALFGVEWAYDDESLRTILDLTDNYRKAMHGSSYVDFMPLLRYVPNKALSNLVLIMKVILRSTTQMFEKNKETFVDGQVRNIADSFISVVKKETKKEKDCNKMKSYLWSENTIIPPFKRCT